MSKKVAVLRGDGVGPELTESAIKVTRAAGAQVDFIACDGGAEWWQANGGNTLIPDASWKKMDEADAIFKGPTTTPGGIGSPKSVAVSIRQKYDLYANVRPIVTYPGTAAPLGQVDFVCVREGTEGLYFGEEVALTNDVYVALRKITRPACSRIARYAFEEAKRRGWKSVVAIHKSNILKKTDGAFLEECDKVHKAYPGIELEEYHVDNVAQQLIKNPQIFNNKVLLSTNLFMDILSEECSALVGSIGLIYSANIGDKKAMFEPAHGSAPKYKGQDKVDPVATVLAGAWMLDYLGQKKQAEAIFAATKKVIAEKKKLTYDLGGNAKQSEMVDAIIAKL
jgi:Isocitrate/isopropylmalate dehydrogenase